LPNKSATNPSLENTFYSTKEKKEWTYIERLEREYKSLNQLYNIHQEQIDELETREKELKEQVESIESSMKKLTRGEHKHKEILFHHARDYRKKRLRSFPEVSKSKIHFSEVGSNFVKNVGNYCQHCHVTDQHIRECHLSNISLPTIPKNSTIYENNHFLLSKVKL
jgi:hypothetical protein